MNRLFTLFAVMLLCGCASNQITVTVTPDGLFSESFNAAKKAAKAALNSEDPRPVVVEFEPGTYFLDQPLTLSPEDSGTDKKTISYVVANPQKTLFSAGRKLPPFQKSADGLWTCKVDSNWNFEQLFVNGKRAVRARTPNASFFKMTSVKEAKNNNKYNQTVTFEPEIFKSIPTGVKGMQMIVLHKWDHTRRFIDSIDPKSGTLITSGKKMKPWNSWKKDTRAYFENFKEALDIAGEWYLDNQGNLFYKPLPGEKIEKTTAYAPVNEKFMIIKGTDKNKVQHLKFEGFRFAYSSMKTPAGGFEPAQAAAPVEAAVMADFASHLKFSEIKLSHVGSYGMWFRRGCRNIDVENCSIKDIGAGGIRIGETGMRSKEEEKTGHIILHNNIIGDGGHIFPCAVGVWIGHSAHNKVTHNDIGHLYYTAVSIGWTWGYNASGAHHNIVQYNHLHNIGKGLLSDMGAVYTLGNSPGTVISNNVIHDIDSYSYGGWGLYTDEGSQGIVMENNLVYRTKSGGFHQHYGKNNIIRKNVFANSRIQQIQATRVEEHTSFFFNNNVIYYSQGESLKGPWDRIKVESGNNLYWNSKGEPVKIHNKSLAEWQKSGKEKDSTVQDPQFVDPDKDNYQVKETSPAHKLGIDFNAFKKAGNISEK